MYYLLLRLWWTSHSFNTFFIPTTPSVSPRWGTRLAMSVPRPWSERTLTRVPVLAGGAILHWPSAMSSTTLCKLNQGSNLIFIPFFIPLEASQQNFLVFLIFPGTDHPKRLDGQIVVITGGNSGIGEETSVDLARLDRKPEISGKSFIFSDFLVVFFKHRPLWTTVKFKFLRHGGGGRKAQRIAFSLRTQQPRARFSHSGKF